MGTPLASIGVKIGYKAGTMSNTYPTTGFTHIPDMKSTADFNPSPNTADATTFDNKEFTTYVDLLKDLGGALEFSANLTNEFKTAWDAVVTAASSDGCWFCIDIPGITDSVVFYGMPSAMGLPSLTANSLMETTVYITPYKEPKWVENAAVSDPTNTTGS